MLLFCFQDETLPGFYNATERLGIIDYDGIITDHRSRIIHTSKRFAAPDPEPLPNIKQTGNTDIHYVVS